MDIEVIRTFLEAAASGSFVGAAERLNISQAAVTTRMQSLEGHLGCSLFHRGRGGAKLTPPGRQFHRYAVMMSRMWDQARLEVTLPSGFTGQVRLGGHYSLWRHFLLRWYHWMCDRASTTALRTEAHANATLTQLLGDGMLDIGVMFDPEQRSGFTVEPLFAEPLVLVSTVPRAEASFDDNYIFVDWGPHFQKFHTTEFSNYPLPARQTNLGAYAVEHVLAKGGSGYFPEPVVEPFLQAGRLHRVQGAPRFATPIYAVYHDGQTNEAVRTALDGLRETARDEAKGIRG